MWAWMKSQDRRNTMPDNDFKNLGEANEFCRKYDSAHLVPPVYKFDLAEALLRAYKDGQDHTLGLLNDLNKLHDKWDSKGGQSGSDNYEQALYYCINELADVIMKHENLNTFDGQGIRRNRG
jgi:hypothetical protein